MVKRGGGIDGLGLGGPQLKNLLNFSEKLSQELDARNAWTHCYNELNPGAPKILQIPRTTWFTFKRLKRDFVLVHDNEAWVLHTLSAWLEARLRARVVKLIGALAMAVAAGVAADRAKAEAEASAADDDDLPPGAGKAEAGVQPKRKRERGERPQTEPPPARDDVEPDEFRPISAAPRRLRREPELQSWRAAIVWTKRKIARRSPRFRHMCWLVQDIATLAEAAVRRFAGQAQKALSRSLHQLNLLVSDAEQIVQHQRFEALPEPRVVERAGRRLTVWTFSAYPRPRWECWLFGRLIEDEQVAV